MLTSENILDYVKGREGVPISYLDISDQEIIKQCQQFVIPYFSRFVPDRDGLAFIDGDDPQYQTGISNEFLFFDPDNRTILNVWRVVQTGPMLMTGHPQFPPTTYPGVANWCLDVTMAETIETFGHDIVYEFIVPNRIRIRPTFFTDAQFMVRYERFHSKTFETIPPEWEIDFLDLCLAQVKDLLAGVRSMSSVTTPFGEVSLNVADLKSEARDIRDSLKEKFEAEPPNVIIHVA
jgi:hypothetical protein